jgi:hypothetical protein
MIYTLTAKVVQILTNTYGYTQARIVRTNVVHNTFGIAGYTYVDTLNQLDSFTKERGVLNAHVLKPAEDQFLGPEIGLSTVDANPDKIFLRLLKTSGTDIQNRPWLYFNMS